MSLIYESLIKNSIDAALASIEIYNKPNFPHREQIFSILIINAWELLLKARILAINEDDISSIYVQVQDGSFKTNRSGNCLTIEIMGALRKLGLASNVVKNIENIVEIRDTAIHFFHEETVSYLIYTLGVASLKNYQRLINEWFDQSLSDYNFYIMPLGFAYNFQTLEIVNLDTKPEIISNLVRSVRYSQNQEEDSSGYHFMCEIQTRIVSAKKQTDDTDMATKIVSEDDSSDAVIITRTQSINDKYPLSWTKLVEKVKQIKSGCNNHQINKIISDFNIKKEKNFSAYNFRNKDKELEYERTGVLPINTPSIYNSDAVRFIGEHIDDYLPQ